MFFTFSRRGARLARRLVVHRLEEWGITRDSDASQGLALIAGELTANAVSHGHVPGRHFHLRLSVQPPPGPDGRRAAASARIEVSDARDGRCPVLRDQGDEAEGGRGLLLVDALASKWGGGAERRKDGVVRIRSRVRGVPVAAGHGRHWSRRCAMMETQTSRSTVVKERRPWSTGVYGKSRSGSPSTRRIRSGAMRSVVTRSS
ncbi:ATP-binding protein [Streptomyces antioxidans]|uniref:ATP-binding protein n=1 Tax=Streptomyces antioxidans TaxID=1507734 RepID=UPI0030B80A15